MLRHTHVRLARLIRDFNLSTSQFQQLVEKFSSRMKFKDNEWVVNQSCADEILHEIQKGVELEYNKVSYTLPSWLKGNDKGWPGAINSLYAEPTVCPASVSPAQGELLRSLIYNIAPKNVVEIGCFLGVSTLWMASALKDLGKDGVVHSIDIFLPKFPYLSYHSSCLVDPLTRIETAIEYAGLKNHINLIQQESKNALQEVNSALKGNGIDLLFIDGDHSVEGCVQDFMNYSPLLSSGSYIILHDIYPSVCGHEGPRYLIDTIFNKHDSEFECVEIATSPSNYGMACIRKK